MVDLRFVFFFSSRRRHTRYIGDWSSDVCSSDLNGAHVSGVAKGRQVRHYPTTQFAVRPQRREERLLELPQWGVGRSEERRVGRGGRRGWAAVAKKRNEPLNWQDGWQALQAVGMV